MRKSDKNSDVDVVRLILTDPFGVPRAKTLSYEQYLRTVDGGHAWASPLLAVDIWQNLPEDDRLGSGNLLVFPDPATFTPLPWHPGTAVVLCGARRGEQAAPTPRDVLSNVLAGAAIQELQPKFGPELEFTLFTADGGTPFGMDQWFTNDALASVAPFVDDLFRYLPSMDIPVYEVFNEHGAGQMEINLQPAMGIQAFDRVVLMKIAIKELAVKHGLRATFMAKPGNDPELAASGFHVHQTVHTADDRNLFELRPDGTPTEETAGYIAGQLEHANAITAFAAPTITAYKRFRPGTWAPMRAGWGVDNRGAMVRLHVAGKNTRVENRVGSSDANPYLLGAAQLAAGLDGLKRSLKPGDPAEHNLADDPAYPAVPSTLPTALDALTADSGLVDAMGREFCELYTSVQRLVCRRYQEYVSDWELREYRSL